MYIVGKKKMNLYRVVVVKVKSNTIISTISNTLGNEIYKLGRTIFANLYHKFTKIIKYMTETREENFD